MIDSSQIVCAVLLVYVLVLLWPKISNLLGISRYKSRAVSSGSMVYADGEQGGVYGTAYMTDSNSFTYWDGDLQNWMYLTPRIVYKKLVKSTDSGFDWNFPSDGLFYCTYNSCFGLVHVSKDFNNPGSAVLTVIASQNRGYSGLNGLQFFGNGASPHLHLQPLNSQSGVLIVYKLFDSYMGISPSNRY